MMDWPERRGATSPGVDHPGRGQEARGRTIGRAVEPRGATNLDWFIEDGPRWMTAETPDWIIRGGKRTAPNWIIKTEQ